MHAAAQDLVCFGGESNVELIDLLRIWLCERSIVASVLELGLGLAAALFLLSNEDMYLPNLIQLIPP